MNVNSIYVVQPVWKSSMTDSNQRNKEERKNPKKFSSILSEKISTQSSSFCRSC